MKKRFRDENGKLTMRIAEIARATFDEAMDYYRTGNIYLNKADGREYVLLMWVPGDGELAHFQSFDGYNIFVPLDRLGTFLPDVADAGMELIKVD